MKNNMLLPNAKSANAQSLTTPAQPTRTKIDLRPSRDEVARRAYSIYLEQGSPEGRDVQHWLEAEAQAMKAHKAGTGSDLTQTQAEMARA